ncbi:MAG TPA: fibronectin type III domain-containing protein [Pyrinomonadaceae bacterium]|nr:fibronectin type III domain-containing protein [Pyrinomonadaceae bacterium]
MKSVIDRLLSRDRRVLFGTKLKQLPKRAFTLQNRRRLVALSLALMLLIAITPPAPRAHNVGARDPQTTNPQVEKTTWLPDLNVGNSVRSLASWLVEKVRGKSPERLTPSVNAYLNPPPPPFLNAPSNLTVTSVSSSSIALSWTAPGGSVDHYQIERSRNVYGPFLLLANTSNTTYPDNSVTAGNAYLYRVRAIGSGGVFSTPSNMALGATFSFGALQGQIIQKQHVYDIRTAVNAVRSVANRTAVSWAIPDLSGALVQASVVQEMRDKLDEALQALNINPGGYDDPILATGSNGTLIRAIHLEQLQTRSTRGSSSSTGPVDTDTSTARLDPSNATGGGSDNPLSRNANWNLPLVNLPGRAGLNLGLKLSYNSLVWTKVGNSTMSFDDDRGFPAPGFRLGFPTIQLPFFNPETGQNAYLLIDSDGTRTDLRQTTDPNLFESADSAHVLLDVTLLTDTADPRMILKSINGTQMTYKLIGQSYECTEIKDRNGNYITVNYNTSGAAVGRIANIHDTLNRVITFNYDNGLLTSITQEWKKQPPNQTQVITHTYASFAYTDLTFDTNFAAGLSVVGVVNNSAKVLSKVTLADNSETLANNSHVDFSYTPFGQIWKFSKSAADANHLLNHRAYKLPKSPLWTDSPAQDDCPRFTERRDWGQWANGDTDKTPATGEEIVTTFSATSAASWNMPDGIQHSGVSVQVTAPDGTFQKIYFADTVANVAKRWLRGLPELVESFDVGGTVAVRQVFTSWEQDNETVSYELNPRVKETNIYDPALAHPKRTRITYQSFTPPAGSSYKLPRDLFEYDSDATTVLRSTRTDYVDGDDALKAPYLSRRLFGLSKESKLYQGDVTNGGTLVSRLGYTFDESGSIQGSDSPVQHDDSNYAASFVTGRGNISTVTRYDVLIADASTSAKMKYNTAGSLVSSKNALDKEVKIDYADSFSDNNNSRGTFAYPTTITDPDNFYSTTKYNFDFGSVTYKQTPPPNATTQATPSPTPVGPAQTLTYDNLGRLERTTNLVNNTYTRYQYPAGKIRMETFSTLVADKGEAYSFTILDGFGRAIARASDHPATTGTTARFDAERTVYDVMGRVIKTSNPTETSASGDDPAGWQLVEGDAGSSWYYTQYTYDWKGRPRVTTNTDGTTRSVTYEGCGCAGGEVATLTDEGTIVNGVTKSRQKKIYSDVLGRTVKTEVWNFDGSGPGGTGRSLYATTVTNYDVLNQAVLVRQFKGAAPTNYLTDTSCPTGTCQKTEFTYDGYGRMQTKHVPEQRQNPYAVTTWTYNADDTVNTITDGRGAVTTYGYGPSGNNRRLVKSIGYTLTGSLPIDVTFSYDAAGNRKSMSHSINGVQQDSCDYTYDQLSRLTSEARHINALSGSATAGDYTIGYGYALGGQLSSVTDPFSSTTNLNYDAIGRTESVNGSYAGTNYTYAGDIEYRAWGAVKRHGVETTSYNNRMQPTQFRNVSYRYDYYYHPDGQLKHLIDLDDMVGQPSLVTFHYMSRDYGYDQAGRLNRVDGTDNPLVNGGFVPAPFVGYYGHNEFNNMVSRSGYYALNTNTSDSATYVDNKRTNTGWTYDADGRVLTSADTATGTSQTWTYDASGRQIAITDGTPGHTSTNTLSYDGNGDLLYESVTTPETTKSDYVIRSSVLGMVLTKLDAIGNKDITYVPTNGLTFHLQTKDSQGNPAVSGMPRDVTGLQEGSYAVDPFGARVFNVQPPNSNQQMANQHVFGPPYSGSGWSTFTDANNFSTGCTLDGVRTNCANALAQVSHGNAFVTGLSTTGTLAEFYNMGLGGLIAATQSGYTGYKDDQKYGLITSAPLRPHVLRTTTAYFLPDSAGEWADVAWTPANFLIVDNLNLGPAFGGDQQDDGRKPMDTSETEKLLTGDCLDFLNRVLGQLKDPYSKDILKVLKKAKEYPLYTRHMTADELKEGLGGTHKSVTNPAFYIYLDESSYAKNPFLLIHELFHGADGAGNGYNHTEMAKAAINAALADPVFMKYINRHGGMPVPKEVDYSSKEWKSRDDWPNAQIFDSLVRLNCEHPIDY